MEIIRSLYCNTKEESWSAAHAFRYRPKSANFSNDIKEKWRSCEDSYGKYCITSIDWANSR